MLSIAEEMEIFLRRRGRRQCSSEAFCCKSRSLTKTRRGISLAGFNDDSTLDHLLILGGSSREVEIISLKNASLKCKPSQLLDTSRVDEFGTGGLLSDNKTPVYCSVIKKRCFSLLAHSPSRDVMLFMQRGFGVPSVPFFNNKTLWILGRAFHEAFSLNRDTTEIVSIDRSKSKWGPKMPLALEGHCAVLINSTMILVAGGGSRRLPGRSTWLYSYDVQNQKGKWFSGPKLIENRTHASCGAIQDQITGNTIVVVAGGTDRDDLRLKSTELWTLDQGGFGWTSGPDLPVDLSHAGSVSGKHAFILVGGKAGMLKSVYKLECSRRDCQWSKMDQKLSRSRYSLTVIPIPNDYADCE